MSLNDAQVVTAEEAEAQAYQLQQQTGQAPGVAVEGSSAVATAMDVLFGGGSMGAGPHGEGDDDEGGGGKSTAEVVEPDEGEMGMKDLGGVIEVWMPFSRMGP